MKLHLNPQSHLTTAIAVCILTRPTWPIDTGIGGTGLDLNVR
jgi:hypothetical protein